MSTQTVHSLFQAAAAEGTISPATAQAIQIPDIGAEIQQGLGLAVDDVESSEVTLVAFLMDDSGSISSIPNGPGLVCEGHNLVLASMAGSKQAESILAHCRYLNGTVLYAFDQIGRVQRMDSNNYAATGGTPLYDQTAVVLATMLAKVQEFVASGVPARGITIIVTDGRDCHSHRFTARKVANLVRDMVKSERHIIAAMGIDDGGSTSFREVFREMGLEDRWILTPGNNPTEIRQAFAMVSQSAVRASQSAGSFSRAATGGFGAP
ncbi:MAG: hypothetical protein UX09_C0029G0004 [Candidatus Uhrbacteria bacterium GW2011_GWE2_45_35]|uniref:VWFA domain-containing protein n=1 Tax=Candidatus Uhrbacteria bacterium GW2011_GWE2_45_35 TaxID=1618993 RepID=A0A0G1QFP0_9BACT|nr:MAG: hypothetical protein UX09_C0029G0004 [Candidatus Uhrbacteria bacterium GW2011_GWE2_45_35]